MINEDEPDYCFTLHNGQCISTDPRCIHNKGLTSWQLLDQALRGCTVLSLYHKDLTDYQKRKEQYQ